MIQPETPQTRQYEDTPLTNSFYPASIKLLAEDTELFLCVCQSERKMVRQNRQNRAPFHRLFEFNEYLTDINIFRVLKVTLC